MAKRTRNKEAEKAEPAQAAAADAAGPASADTPPTGEPAGTFHGEPLNLTDEQRARLPRLDPGAADDPARHVSVDAAEVFREKFPRLSAAVEAFRAAHEEPPTVVRIVSKVEGFRRAGIAHPKVLTEHPITDFMLPEDLEQLLAEPNLTVELA